MGLPSAYSPSNHSDPPSEPYGPPPYDYGKSKQRNPMNWDEAMMGLNSIIPYLRPSDTEGLDPRQLLGEMYALSDNQLEPVQAQSYQPQLGTPYDISLQDQLNEVTAQSRAAERMSGHNPAAQAMIASGAYKAKSSVLAEQFRHNQTMKDKVYGENRTILNDAYLRNLAINDQQYERQAKAKSNTKTVTLEALKSISDKYLKNQLENRTLATYENLYNYRYDPRFRAQNMNPLAQFNLEGQLDANQELPDDKQYTYTLDPSTGQYVRQGIKSKPKNKKEK